MAQLPATLSRREYLDDEVFDLERQRIFHRVWMLATRAELIAPGSRQVVDLSGESVILTRDSSGVLHAHANVCRHRGARLCTAGTTDPRSTITCPYHGWAYALDGRLIGTPHLSNDDVDRSTLPLWGHHVAEWNGFVFVSVAAEPPEFADWLASECADLLALEEQDEGGEERDVHQLERGQTTPGQLAVGVPGHGWIPLERLGVGAIRRTPTLRRRREPGRPCGCDRRPW